MTTTAVIDSTTNLPMITTMAQRVNMKPMWMWFHTTVNDVVLFESWTVKTSSGSIKLLYAFCRSVKE
uniref:DOMON domain-containing protein n=1 Tax=Angiostrongylus cantonensis TaxID=6313 RepID=A0A0K0CUJ2_ANGCA